MIEQFTDEQIIHWFAKDFADSKGMPAVHEILAIQRVEERNGFDIAEFYDLDRVRREKIIDELTEIFIRKHQGQDNILPKLKRAVSQRYRKKARKLLKEQVDLVASLAHREKRT